MDRNPGHVAGIVRIGARLPVGPNAHPEPEPDHCVGVGKHATDADREGHTMATDVRDVLHQIHTATNDVLEGYKTMLDRAEPEIQPVLSDLRSMHERHAADQKIHLDRLGEASANDESWRGTMNKAAVTMRDWVSDLDRDSLSAVRRGEEALRDIYRDTLADWTEDRAPDVAALLTEQQREIDDRVIQLPNS